jgi:phenylpropionate dioxygenase-like ring-hydroxylating dioxygenase large terminal subunit
LPINCCTGIVDHRPPGEDEMEGTSGRGASYSGYETPIGGAPDRELTQTGRGTPGGEYLRRFWQPVCYAHELTDVPLRLRILGEDLVAFRDKGGAIGLLHLHCSHRGSSLEFGIIQERGLRCCYHGRVFDVDGTVLEMPGERAFARLSKETRQGAYPTHVFGGIVFAYLGPMERIPPFPTYDKYNLPGMKLVPGPRLPFACNWVQIKENAMDPAHTAILHALEGWFASQFGKFPEITWMETPVGMAYVASRRVDDKVWIRSTDIMMPNIHSITSVFEDGQTVKDWSPPWLTMWTVPVDDDASINFCVCHIREDDTTPTEKRNYAMSYGQTPERSYAERQRIPGDYDAMTSQGPITIHEREFLGTLDQGVAMFRKLLRQGIRDVRDGKEPLGLLRSTAPAATYGNDRVVPVAAMPGDPADRDALLAFARSVGEDYLRRPPLSDATAAAKP